jgi:hypothetical protein
MTAPALGPRERLLTALLLALPALYFAHAWLGYREAWLHPELLGTSEYIWNFPETERLGDRLRKIADWKAFDPNVNRVRPLNDIAEVVDAIARPYVARYLFPHPSLTPIGVITAVSAPLLFFAYFCRTGVGMVGAGALTGLFISSVAFASVEVAYIRPAKKLTILAFIAVLYLAERHARDRRAPTFIALVSVMFASFFADELALAVYPIVVLMFFHSLVAEAPPWKRGAIAVLPILFLAAVYGALPAVYTRFSVHGSWDALTDGQKLRLFAYLEDPQLYAVALVHTARAVLTTLGIHRHDVVTEVLALVALVGGTAVVVWRLRKRGGAWPLVASMLSLLGAALYATLLDWYPFPGEVSYLGSFTFYYHSPLAVLVIVWLGSVARAGAEIARDRGWRPAMKAGGVAIGTAAIVANFALTHHINRLVGVMHTYPYSSASVHAAIAAKLPEIRAARPGEVVRVEFTREPVQLSRDFDAAARAVFGRDGIANDFQRTFNTFKATPLWREEHLGYLLHAYFPYIRFEVRDDSR